MDEKLREVLEPLGYPVKLQGSLQPNEPYPDHFFTYWNDSADGASFYSNTEGAILWAYSLNFYSTNPELAQTVLLEAKKRLKAEDFIVSGAGYDVPSDEETHTGRGISLLYRQKQ